MKALRALAILAALAVVGCGGGGGGSGDSSTDWNGTWLVRVTSVNNPCGVGGAPIVGTDQILTVTQNGVIVALRNLETGFTASGSTTQNGDSFVATTPSPSAVTCTNGVNGFVEEQIAFQETGNDTASVVYQFGATCSSQCVVSATGAGLRQ